MNEGGKSVREGDIATEAEVTGMQLIAFKMEGGHRQEEGGT